MLLSFQIRDIMWVHLVLVTPRPHLGLFYVLPNTILFQVKTKKGVNKRKSLKVGTVHTFNLHLRGTVPTINLHHVGTLKNPLFL